MKATLKLYEISADYLMALEALADLDDMPPEAIADTLEGLAGEWSDKALNVARYVRTLEGEAAAIDDARKKMDGRAKALGSTVDKLKAYLKAEMEKTGLTPKAADLALKLQKNPPSVVVDDETQIPATYKHTETVTSILKAEISTALKAGSAVPGAHLAQSKRLVIA